MADAPGAGDAMLYMVASASSTLNRNANTRPALQLCEDDVAGPTPQMIDLSRINDRLDCDSLEAPQHRIVGEFLTDTRQ